ncbi:hypothetical protein ACWDOP_04610 [Nocardia sp. NPDC003693]
MRISDGTRRPAELRYRVRAGRNETDCAISHSARQQLAVFTSLDAEFARTGRTSRSQVANHPYHTAAERNSFGYGAKTGLMLDRGPMNHENRWFPLKPTSVREPTGGVRADMVHGTAEAERPRRDPLPRPERQPELDMESQPKTESYSAAEAQSKAESHPHTEPERQSPAIPPADVPRDPVSEQDREAQRLRRIRALEIRDEQLRALTLSRPPDDSAPARTGSVTGRITGLLLLVSAALTIPASFLPLRTKSIVGPRPTTWEQWDAWRISWFSVAHPPATSLQLLGALLAVSGGLSAVIGVIRVFVPQRRIRYAAWELGIVAPALSFGVTSTAALDVLSATALDDLVQVSETGTGLWFLVAVAAVSLVALFGAAFGDHAGRPAPERQSMRTRRGAVDVVAALLFLTGVSALLGSLLPLIDHPGMSSVTTTWWVGPKPDTQLQYLGVPLVLFGFGAAVVAVMMFSGRGLRDRHSRTAGLSLSGILLGATCTVVLNTYSFGQGPDVRLGSGMFDLVGAGFWMLFGALVLSIGATVAGLCSGSGNSGGVDGPDQGGEG